MRVVNNGRARRVGFLAGATWIVAATLLGTAGCDDAASTGNPARESISVPRKGGSTDFGAEKADAAKAKPSGRVRP